MAWLLASRLRDGLVLWTGRTGGAHADVLPHDRESLIGLAAVLGQAGSTTETEEAWLRSSRRARAVVERVFYA